MSKQLRWWVCALVLAGYLGAQSLGHIEFPTSGGAEAERHFVQGVLLLHSFEYADAREEFQAASKIEPKFAMAYWGEALSYTHPIWMQQDVAAARAALGRLAATGEARMALAPTEREKGYLQSVEILYGEGDKAARDLAYARAMERLMKKYPDDLEAASLYAVALLGTCEYERNERTYMKAAAVAEEVFAKNPQHPGAIHYLIHAYDDPIHAPLGLRAARVYGKVAGAASHAQHMPAHIFFALGMWDEAIAANVASVAVADERIKRKGLGVGDRNYHSLLWLEYAYLQEGRASEARRVLDGIQQARPLAHMSAVYAIETGDWEKPPSGLDLTQADLLTRMMVWNAEGLVDVAHGRIDEARGRGEAAKKALTQGSGGEETGHGGMAMGEAPNTHKLAEIMSEQIDTAILYATGKRVEAFEVLGRAASEEDALSFEFGPPTPLKPTHELFGELLLKAGRAKEARHEFERVLERAPGRAQAMKGLEKAQEEAGDGAAAWRLREPGKR